MTGPEGGLVGAAVALLMIVLVGYPILRFFWLR